MTQFWIEDHAAPGSHKDYAIVARLVDPNTDQFVVVAAGIGRGGTVAAGEFLVDQQRMGEMLKQIPKYWIHKNLEIVLETQVIEGRSGPSRISAFYTR